MDIILHQNRGGVQIISPQKLKKKFKIIFFFKTFFFFKIFFKYQLIYGAIATTFFEHFSFSFFLAAFLAFTPNQRV